MAGRNTYDLSPTEKEILEHRHARRTLLRHEYWQSVTNPYHHALGAGGHIEDPAIERFMAARNTMSHFWKPTFKNFGFFCATYILPVTILYFVISNDRKEKEHKYRTGQIAYGDRLYKIL